MQAIYIKKFGTAQQAFEMKDVAKPVPKPNEVLIRCEGFGLNYADVMARKGVYPDAPKLPFVPGYDVCGIVEQVGSGVSLLKPGDRVAAMTRFGGYAEYAITDERACVHIGQQVPVGEALALTVQYSTAYYCAAILTSLLPGDKVLIQAAAGGVGTALVQYCLHKGCIVFGTAGTAKQDYLRKMGVHHPIDYTKTDFFSEIKKITSGRGIDVVYDSVGGSSFRKGYKLLAPGGRIVGLGVAAMNKRNIFNQLGGVLGFGIFHPVQLLMHSKSMLGCNMLRIADNQPQVLQHCMQQVYSLYQTGVFKPEVSRVFPSSEIVTAHEFLEQRKSMGKVVVVF